MLEMNYDIEKYWNLWVLKPQWDQLNQKEQDTITREATKTMQSLLSNVLDSVRDESIRRVQDTINKGAMDFFNTIQRTQRDVNTRISEQENHMRKLDDQAVENIWRQHCELRWEDLTEYQKISAKTEIAKAIWQFMYDPNEASDLNTVVNDLIARWYEP